MRRQPSRGIRKHKGLWEPCMRWAKAQPSNRDRRPSGTKRPRSRVWPGPRQTSEFFMKPVRVLHKTMTLPVCGMKNLQNRAMPGARPISAACMSSA
jgi:hypothetical protein